MYAPERGGHLKPDEEQASTADWADESDVAASAEIHAYKRLADLNGAFLLGGAGDGRTWVGYTDDRHIVTIAGSRAGKGVSASLPNLALWPGSIIVTDPKGENAVATAAARVATGQQVAIIDPFGVTAGTDAAQHVARYNPLLHVEAAASPADEAALLADALVIQESGPGQHFTMAARNLLHGLIAYVAELRQGTLVDVRDIVAGDAQSRGDALDYMRQCGGTIAMAGDLMAATAESFLSKPPQEQASVLSTAQEHTAFLSSPAVRDSLSATDFEMEELRGRQGLSLYIALPPRHMSTHGRLLRLMVTTAFAEIEAQGLSGEGADRRVLACLDEMPAMGHLPIIEAAAGYMAGYGLTVWSILQDLSQLKRHYAEGWETFLGNAGLVQAFGNTDMTTLDYLQKRLGERAILSRNVSLQGTVHGQSSTSYSLQTVPLARAEEIGRIFGRNTGRQLVLTAGSRPLILSRVPYSSDRTLRRTIAG